MTRKAARRKKNIVAGVVSLVAMVLVFLSAVTSEGDYVCISKVGLGVIAASLMPLYRIVGDFVRGDEEDG